MDCLQEYMPSVTGIAITICHKSNSNCRKHIVWINVKSCWRHAIKSISALLALCDGNLRAIGGYHYKLLAMQKLMVSLLTSCWANNKVSNAMTLTWGHRDMMNWHSSCYHHQIWSIHLSHCFHIFPWLCAWDVCYIIFCHSLHIHSGITGNLFSLVLCSLWWVQIVD